MTRNQTGLPDLLRVALRSASVPQREAAQTIGISQQALADRLTGRRPITIGEALKVAYLAGIDIDAAARLAHEVDLAQARLDALVQETTEELHRALITSQVPVLV